MNSLSNGAFKHSEFLHLLNAVGGGEVIIFKMSKCFYMNIQPVFPKLEDYL